MHNNNSFILPHFDKLKDFVVWYLKNGKPILIPDNFEVFETDDATACCLFRSGRYQVEMYLVHPNPLLPPHEHPQVENIEIPSGAWSSLKESDLDKLLQVDGQAHGESFKERGKYKGFMIMSFQRWAEGLEITTIGSRWKGHTVGEKHENLIKRFNPKAVVYPGYADVTQNRNIQEIL